MKTPFKTSHMTDRLFSTALLVRRKAIVNRHRQVAPVTA